jgi:multisubunit Na+/H+ antiporter MnhF subunit
MDPGIYAMTELCGTICLILLATAALIALYRLVAGPTVLDRIVAFDMIAICIVGMMVLLSVLWRTQLFLELMLIFSLLGFVGTVAFVSYLQRDRRNARRIAEAAKAKGELL